MSLNLPPNMEALVSAFLRNQAEVVDIAGDRVYTATPKDATYPLVRVTQLLDVPAGAPLWAIGFEIQVEAFGGSKDQAWRLAATCRAAIDERIEGVHDGYGVVNGTTPGALIDLPDETFRPAKPRYLFTSTIYGHAGAIVPS